jgi:hypothetical protein
VLQLLAKGGNRSIRSWGCRQGATSDALLASGEHIFHLLIMTHGELDIILTTGSFGVAGLYL